MTKINRRHFLMAATTACAGIVPAPARTEAIARPYELPRFDGEKGQFRRDYWFIKRELDLRPDPASNEAGRPTIDFWSREYSDVPYADHLPLEIPIGVLFYDPFGSPHVEALKHIDLAHKTCRPNAEHQFAAHMDGIETLSSTLRQMIHDEPSRPEHSRTALIALDSVGPSPDDPEWTGLLPVFAQCYDHIIGHIHAPRRGLRDWKTFLNAACEEDFFEQSVWSCASQCDVVIVTSAGLVETDPGLPTSATTEMLVGELMLRLGHALLNREVLDQVLGVHRTGQKRKPRLFALSSKTLTAGRGYPYKRPYSEYKADFDQHDQTFFRQDALVSDCFGRWADRERPLLTIATRIDYPWRDRFAEFERNAPAPRDPPELGPPWPRTPLPPGWKLLFEVPAPAHEANSKTLRLGGAIDLITLWPFEFDGKTEHSS